MAAVYQSAFSFVVQVRISVAQWITHPSPKGKIAGSNPVRDVSHAMNISVVCARLAQMVERMTLNHVVAGSIPAVGVILRMHNTLQRR